MSGYDEAVIGGRPQDDLYPGRRQLHDLTAEDLRAHPAWWFPPADGHLSGPDAGTVMPIGEVAAAEDGACAFPDGRFLLHAAFRLADGSSLDGHVTYVAGESVDVTTQEPTLCTGGGQVPLWHGVIVPDAATTARFLAALARTHEQVFPLTWRATLHPPGLDLAGTAEGFLVWRDGGVGTGPSRRAEGGT